MNLIPINKFECPNCKKIHNCGRFPYSSNFAQGITLHYCSKKCRITAYK